MIRASGQESSGAASPAKQEIYDCRFPIFDLKGKWTVVEGVRSGFQRQLEEDADRSQVFQSAIVKSTMPLLSPLVHGLFGIEWEAGFRENQTAIILFALENVCPADVFSLFR